MIFGQVLCTNENSDHIIARENKQLNKAFTIPGGNSRIQMLYYEKREISCHINCVYSSERTTQSKLSLFVEEVKARHFFLFIQNLMVFLEYDLLFSSDHNSLLSYNLILFFFQYFYSS